MKRKQAFVPVIYNSRWSINIELNKFFNQLESKLVYVFYRWILKILLSKQPQRISSVKRDPSTFCSTSSININELNYDFHHSATIGYHTITVFQICPKRLFIIHYNPIEFTFYILLLWKCLIKHIFFVIVHKLKTRSKIIQHFLIAGRFFSSLCGSLKRIFYKKKI